MQDLGQFGAYFCYFDFYILFIYTQISLFFFFFATIRCTDLFAASAENQSQISESSSKDVWKDWQWLSQDSCLVGSSALTEDLDTPFDHKLGGDMVSFLSLSFMKGLITEHPHSSFNHLCLLLAQDK